MNAPIFAGFECGYLHWNSHDLLHSTGHLPGGGMERHYTHAVRHGAAGARDGLSWRHDITARVRAVPDGFPVIWDMVHFDMPPDPEAHAAAVADALGPGGRCIAVNEPTQHGRFHGEGSIRYVETAIRMMRAAPGLRYASCDPLHSLEPAEWWATDRLVESGLIETVGINYYPIHTRTPLRDIIREAKARYPGVPLGITETSWHVGHDRLPVGDMRLQWLDHVQQECEAAGGVDFVCWYPWLDMPCWDMSGEVWPCGFPCKNPDMAIA